MKILVLFIVLNVANVILQTVKSIATIKCGKVLASLINALAFGLYTYVIFYTSIDGIALWEKALIVAIANLIGVYVVKSLEERVRKDRLWKVEFSIPSNQFENVNALMSRLGVSFSYMNMGKWVLMNAYCPTQKDTAMVKSIIEKYHAKYFVSESKTL